ncbi:MAG: hypothetical protein QXU90_00375 [Acidilobaceae archaeon]
MIQDILPLLDGWSYSILGKTTPFIVPRGTEKVIDESKKPGWIVTAICTLDNPDATFIVTGYDSYRGYIENAVTPRTLKDGGAVYPNPFGLWVSRYDDTEKRYTIAFTPDDWLPFTTGYKIAIRAPMNSDVTVYRYDHVLILIYDREAFIRSLREVLGTR